METITTTDGMQVIDGNTVLRRVCKTSKNTFNFHQIRARDYSQIDSEIFFYKRNAQWRKSNLNKNNRVPCPYKKSQNLPALPDNKYLVEQWKNLAHYNQSMANMFKNQLEYAVQKFEEVDKEKKEWEKLACNIAEVLERERDTGNYHLPETDTILREFRKFKKEQNTKRWKKQKEVNQ